MNDPLPLPVQRRLLTAATGLFATKGYHATRVADIVRAASVAQGTFYLYFANKERIFVALIDDFFARLISQTLTAAPVANLHSRQEVLATVHQLWRAVLQRCLDEREMVIMLQRDAGALGPGVMAQVQAQYQILVDALAEQIRLGTALGLVQARDPVLAAWAIVGMGERVISYALQLQPPPAPAQIDQMAQDLAHWEFAGLLAQFGNL